MRDLNKDEQLLLDRDYEEHTTYTCKICRKSYTKENYLAHIDECIDWHEMNDGSKPTREMYDVDEAEETVYTCKYCGRPFDLESALLHQDFCLGNYHIHKACVTCEHFEVHKFAPTEENHNGYENELAHLITGGFHNEVYCKKKLRYLKDEDFGKTQDKCYKLGTSPIEYIETIGYTEFFDDLIEELKKDKSNLK